MPKRKSRRIENPYTAYKRPESPRNLFIWWQRFMQTMPICDIARYHGITPERVKQIFTRVEVKRELNEDQFTMMVYNAI